MIDIQILASSSRGNCYKISDGKTSLLLECGIKFKQIQVGLRFKLSEIAGCLISHEHKDHCIAVQDIMRAGIDCYMSWGTAVAAGASGHRVRVIKAREQFEIGTWTILPFELQHDAAEPLGFLLQNTVGDRLLFVTDTYYVKYRFNNLTHIMIECNYSIDTLYQNIASGAVPEAMKKRLLRSHFNLESVKDFLRANDLSKVQQIYLLHLSDSNSDADRFKREIAELTGKEVYVADA